MGRGWGGWEKEGVGRDYGWVSFWDAEDVLGLGSGDGCTTLEIKTTEPLYTLKGQVLWYVDHFSSLKNG